MSRARLGFYVFCRKSLFGNCYELTEVFKHFNKRPQTLSLNLGESFPTKRMIDQEVKQIIQINDVHEMIQIVQKHGKLF